MSRAIERISLVIPPRVEFLQRLLDHEFAFVPNGASSWLKLSVPSYKWCTQSTPRHLRAGVECIGDFASRLIGSPPCSPIDALLQLPASHRLNHPRDRSNHPLELGDLDAELLAPSRRQSVVA